MEALSITLMSRAGWIFKGDLSPLLNQFEADFGCKVQLTYLTWDTGMEDLLAFARSQDRPVLSEIGTSWTASLVETGTLRPFSPAEVSWLGGEWTFLPTSWKTAMLENDSRVWAIPSLSDLRFIYYWRDLLEAVGVRESTAFQSQEQFVQAVERIGQRNPGIAPLVFPTARTRRASLHYLASWIWSAGGDFLSPDGKRHLLHLPETRQGVRRHLELGRLLTPAARGLDPDEVDGMFWDRKAAISLSSTPRLTGLWMRSAQRPPNLGAAPVPGVLFVGGSNFVVWQGAPARQQRLALDLIRFLTGPHAQVAFSLASGQFPARANVLESPPFSTDRFYSGLIRAMRSGRSYPSTPIWGPVEDRLARLVAELWEAVIADPQRDLAALVDEQLDAAGQDLDQLLSAA